MFEAYDHRLSAHRPKAFAVPGVALLVAVFATIQVRSVWTISAFTMPREPISMAIALPAETPPPPAKLGGGAVRPAPVKPAIKSKVDAHVQPVKPTPDAEPISAQVRPDAPPGEGVPDGKPDGDRNGRLGGFGTGTNCDNGLAPDAEPCGTGTETGPRGDIPPPQRLVPPTAFRANRVAGNEQIQPDDITKLEVSRAGKTRLAMSVKVCVGSAGDVTAATQIGSGTGFAAYDAKIVRAVSAWRYNPFVINGRATPACSVVQFVYVQR